MQEVTRPEETTLRKALKVLPTDIEDSSNSVILGIHKLYSAVNTPVYATAKSACFDVFIYLGNEIQKVDCYNRLLMKSSKRVVLVPEIGKRGVHIEPGECLYIPTGIIFDIPLGYKLNFYPRSGKATQKHLKLGNCVGIIDEDYVEQTFITVFNDSMKRQVVAHDDKLAQCEIVPVFRTDFKILVSPPSRKTNRVGGFGHTG
jgi:dUTP pyrophosphatase